MQEAVDYLKGQPADPRLHQVTMRLAARLLTISGQFSAETDALARLEGDLASGKALETFARMIAKLGGPADFTDHPAKYLPQAPVIRPVFSRNAGYVESMDTRNIGLSIIGLKGGRTTSGQKSIIPPVIPVSVKSAIMSIRKHRLPLFTRPTRKILPGLPPNCKTTSPFPTANRSRHR